MRQPAGAALDLQPSYRVLDQDLPRPAPPRPSRPSPAPETTKQNLDRILAEDQADQDLSSGRVHPHLYQVQRDAEGMFRPSWSLVEGDAARLGQLGPSTKSWIRALGREYLKSLRRHHQTRRRRGDQDRHDLLEGYSSMLRATAEAADRLACVVCLSLGQKEPAEPQLVRSSGRAPFDRQAVQAVRQAARSRGAPPDLGPVQACYSVEARFFRIPPIPVVGCSFDESKPSVSCYYPTRKVQQSSVRLVSIRRRPSGS